VHIKSNYKTVIVFQQQNIYIHMNQID